MCLLVWLRCLVSWSQTGTWWNFPANRISRVVVTGIDRKLLDTSHQARRDHQDRPWRLLESQHRKLTILSPPRLKYSSNNEKTSVKSTAFWLSVWKKWCLEREPTQLTLCSSDPMPKLKTNIVKPRKRRFYFIESNSDIDWTIPWTV